MRKNSINILCLLLSVCLLMCILTACLKSEAENSGHIKQSSTMEKTAQSGRGVLPIANKPVTLTYAREFSSYAAATMKDYNEMACYKELEKRTGIHIENKLISPAQRNEQFTLMMLSDDLPDMIHWNWSSYHGGPAKVMEEGYIISLNSYIDKYAINFKKYISNNLQIKKQIVTASGDYYCFPYISSEPDLNVYAGPVIRKDWLDNLGLKLPYTIHEWYKVLKAFKERDPNGNGKADEIPFLPSAGFGIFPYSAFIGAWGIETGFYQDNGIVKYGPIEAPYKDFLTEMNKWYREGLIDLDFGATNAQLFEAKATGNRLGAFIGIAGAHVVKFNTVFAQKGSQDQFVGAPYPSLMEGQTCEIGQNRPAYTGQGTVITKNCKYVEEAVKWLDYHYSPEGHELINMGIEGVSYDRVEGNPRLKQEVLNDPGGLPLLVSIARYSMASIGGPFVASRAYAEQSRKNGQFEPINKQWILPAYPKSLPPLAYTTEESNRRAEVESDINSYVYQQIVRFIMGTEPISNYEQFKATLIRLGIQEMVKTTQSAYDRYMEFE